MPPKRTVKKQPDAPKAAEKAKTAPSNGSAASKRTSKMPVTLVSGFLGSGKTSLLSHVLLNKDHKMKCAVIVNEISDFNVDALAVEGAALLQSEEKMVEMSNGCICCTLREDLLEQLVDLHKKGFDAVLIESSGIAEPMQVAETFFFPMDGRPNGKTLQSIAPLDNCVTVVDAGTLIEHMNSIDSTNLLDKSAKGTEDERNIAALMFDQLEFANVIILNKIDRLDAAVALKHAEDDGATKGKKGTSKATPKGKQAASSKAEPAITVETLTALIRRINPYAKVIPVTYSKVDLKEILQTNNFTEKFAISIQGWMEDVKTGLKHVPETLEYGVSSMSFTPKVPFHPQRLFDWMRKYFILDEMMLMTPAMIEERNRNAPKLTAKEKAAKEKAWSEDVAQRSHRRLERYGNLFRGKGFAWIGQPRRWHIYGTWSQAGNTLSFGAGGTWDQFPQNTSAELVAVDPGQRLVFIGQDLKKDVLLEDLKGLLLTAEEVKTLGAGMRKPLRKGEENMDRPDVFPDPFGPFEVKEDGAGAADHGHQHSEHCSHDHGHSESPKSSRKTQRAEKEEVTPKAKKPRTK